MKRYKMLSAVLLLTAVWGCSSLKLTQTDFAWPVESVLKIDDQGTVTDNRFSFTVNVKPLFFTETKDSLSYKSKELRIIRDTKGFYYLTSEGFKNVYLFQVIEGAFKLYDTILINEKGISAPAMNQRLPYVELISGSNKYLLNNEGLKK
jgi:hypothetical protein